MSGRAAADVLSLPVRMHGIQLGRPVEILLDRLTDRVIGFELRCGDGAHRFLPFAVANLRADEIVVGSALALIDERELDFYRRQARRLPELSFAEPWIDDDGTVREAHRAA
jgi:hypothetical protein